MMDEYIRTGVYTKVSLTLDFIMLLLLGLTFAKDTLQKHCCTFCVRIP